MDAAFARRARGRLGRNEIKSLGRGRERRKSLVLDYVQQQYTPARIGQTERERRETRPAPPPLRARESGS